jgi:hypothetical protein
MLSGQSVTVQVTLTLNYYCQDTTPFLPGGKRHDVKVRILALAIE